MSDLANMKPKHIITLENIDNTNENFLLRSPPKGKIIRGPISNAFNRQSLGSIPSKSEKILFKDNETEVKKGFASQCERFAQYRTQESVKYSFPGPGDYENTKNLRKNLDTNPSFSSKGYCTGFTSKNERFDDLREYYEKYLPGPGEYNSKLSLNQDIYNKSNLRFKSLYNTNKMISLKVYKDNPGPGDYDPLKPGLILNENENSPNYFFKSKEERFNISKENVTSNPGPGKYFFDSNLKTFNKKDSTSFFFRENIPKKLNPLEKILKLDKNKIFETPGPGEYNLRKELIKVEKNPTSSSRSIFLINDKKKFTEYENDIKIEKLKNAYRRDNSIQIQPQNIIFNFENSKKSIRSVFLSKSPRNSYTKSNHVPGPTYYHPGLLPERKSYNANEDKIWI
jgi:hypothetical protein